MSKARKVPRPRKVRKGPISLRVSPKVQQALDKMKAEGRKVQVVGGVERGRVEMDPQGLAAVTKKFPGSTIAFVALNAPFKTRALTGSF